ncbi:MAG: S8 family serine peptidase, partial [Ignavibacteriaceae bacterium]|nr:S8 family serine peptidase [Ignavibacteriaceae bacterium]
GLKISNHSYGSIRGWVYDYHNDGKWAWFGTPSISETEDYLFGFYSSTSASWDYFMVNAPNILVCKSAGNDRGDGPTSGTAHWIYVNNVWVWSSTVRDKDGGINGYDCINDGVGISKNSLTVGAVNDIVNGYNSPSDVSVTSWSNEGPTDDGRIKPDIVANGTDLYSSTNTSNTAYTSISGTSMSSPNVAGSVALILEQQAALNGPTTFLRSSTVKGLIIHTADEAGTAPGPDYKFGWGLMNTYRAVQLLTLDSEIGGNQLIRELTLNQGGTQEFTVESNGTEPLKVTICWLDIAGTPPQASLNPTNLMLVNDLDLTVTGPNSTIHYPWVLDPANPSAAATTGNNFRDNVEQVLIESPVAGTYTIKIGHKNNLSTGSQQFSVIVSGNVVPVPDIVSLVEPENNAQGVSSIQLLCKWTRAPKSMRYEIQASTDSTFNTGVLSFNSKILTGTLTNLPELSVVYWRVRAINGGGNGGWSNVYKFTTSYAYPSPPNLISPANNSVHQDIDQEFLWDVVSNATEYNYQLSNNVPFTDIIIDTTLLTNSYSLDNLQEGKKLYWRVSSINPTGTSAFSPKSNFTTKLKAPDSLTVSVDSNNDVLLNWIDKSSVETNYIILRRTESSSPIKLDSIGADQTSYIDTSAQAGTAYYYAVYCNNSTASSDTTESSLIVVSVEKEEDAVPTEYSLKQNYPNPFNPNTVIKYSLAQDGFVNIAVFNLLGEKVATLVNTTQRAGNYEVNFNASSFSSGIYFYSMEAGDYKSARKMLLMK